MSESTTQDRIRRNPKFAELVQRRTSFAVVLSLLVLVPYYSFMMLVAFNPGLLKQPLGESGKAPVGQVVALCPALPGAGAPIHACRHARQAMRDALAGQATITVKFSLATQPAQADARAQSLRDRVQV